MSRSGFTPPSQPTGSSSRSDGAIRRRIVKKNKIKPITEHNDRQSDAVRKQGVARLPQPAGDGLTCNETQVEDILAEGEST